MRLELDVGNTRIKWCLLSEGKVIDSGAEAYSGAIDLPLLRTASRKITQLIVSSVAGQAVHKAVVAFSESLSLTEEVYFIRQSSQMNGVHFAYEDISRLGVDRCLAMIGAYHLVGSGVLVIDCGSAITADLVNGSGEHIGGFILPGVRMLESSLLGGTAKVLVEHETVISTEWGVSTEECVEHGRAFLLKSLFASLFDFAKTSGVDRVVVTGGDGDLVSLLLERPVSIVPDLVFLGIRQVVPF